MASDRVPTGNCQVIRSRRRSTSWQKATIQSLRTMAVRSWNWKSLAPYARM